MSIKIASDPIINWPVNLYLDLRPWEFLYLILSISSKSPKPPRLKETKSNVQT